MKRKFEFKLNEWKEKYSDTPLMVVGARQIGKTYIINEFCQNNYDDYCELFVEQIMKDNSKETLLLDTGVIIIDENIYNNIKMDNLLSEKLYTVNHDVIEELKRRF